MGLLLPVGLVLVVVRVVTAHGGRVRPIDSSSQYSAICKTALTISKILRSCPVRLLDRPEYWIEGAVVNCDLLPRTVARAC